MEINQLIELAEESIKVEMNVSALYRLFSEALPADTDFWWQLHLEEKNHTMLIRAAKDSLAKRGKFPNGLVDGNIEELKQANIRIEALIKQCQGIPPTRYEACEIAIQIENEAGESHYEIFMGKVARSPLENVFQQLNRDDKEHGLRIRDHLESLRRTRQGSAAQ